MSEKHGKREKTDFALPVLKHFWSYCIITYIHYLRSIYIRKRKVTNHVFTSLLLSSIHFFINIFSVAFPGAWLHISVLHSVYYGEGNSKCVWFFLPLPPPLKKKTKTKKPHLICLHIAGVILSSETRIWCPFLVCHVYSKLLLQLARPKWRLPSCFIKESLLSVSVSKHFIWQCDD